MREGVRNLFRGCPRPIIAVVCDQTHKSHKNIDDVTDLGGSSSANWPPAPLDPGVFELTPLQAGGGTPGGGY